MQRDLPLNFLRRATMHHDLPANLLHVHITIRAHSSR
jgi:hypothetical protein